MTRFINTLSHYPTVVPTTVLMFCLLWFAMSLLLSGFGHGHAGHAGHTGHGSQGGRTGHGSHTGHAGHGDGGARTRLDGMPLSLSATVVSLGAWIVCLLASLGIDALDLHGTTDIAAKTAVLVVGVLAGVGLLVAFAVPAEKVLVMSTAPGRAEAVGAMCKIRTLRNGSGDAKITTGRAVGSIIPFEAVPGDQLAVGDDALIVSYDPVDERFVVGHLDELLR